MQQYYDLEVNIMSCLLLKHELMEQVKFEDKHIVKHKELWQFMKAFYKRFKTFDVVLMFNTCKNKPKLIKYVEYLLEVEPVPDNFYKYQDLLIELYNQKLEEKAKVAVIQNLTNDLVVGNIDILTFKRKINELLEVKND